MHRYKTVNTENCGSCGSTVNTFRHFMNHTLVEFLEHLPHDGSARSVREIYRGSLKASPDAGYLIHWGMVERVKRGYYKITDKGIDFLNGSLAHEWIDVRLGEIIGKSDTRVDRTCLPAEIDEGPNG